MKKIVFGTQKGGCAKTTSTWALGTGLHMMGKRVLFVDLDAQRNLSFTAGVDLLNLKTSLYDVFKRKANIKDALNTIKDGMDILTGGLNLASADMDFNQQGREFMLAECLDQLKDDYDFCLIDISPSLGVMTANALVSADMVIIPIQADIYGLQGVVQLKGFIDRIRTGYRPPNPNLKIGGLLLTRVDERTNLTKVMIEEINDTATEMGTRVFNSKIHASVSIGESALLKKSIYEVAPKSKVAYDYLDFIHEFLGIINE